MTEGAGGLKSARGEVSVPTVAGPQSGSEKLTQLVPCRQSRDCRAPTRLGLAPRDMVRHVSQSVWKYFLLILK